MKKNFFYLLVAILMTIVLIHSSVAQKNAIGVFNHQADVGKVLHKGSAIYDPQKMEYFMEGSGYNIWSTHDEFHFLWKKMKGDFVVSANFAFATTGGKDDKKNRMDGKNFPGH